MLLRRKASASVLMGFAMAAVFVSTAALGQDEAVPKVDIFAGYQWINPGGTVPTPGVSPNAQVGFQLKSISQGVGVAGAYNFTKYLAMEADYGGNWNKYNDETTLSMGPRLMFRGEGVNYFIHTMVSYNRLTVKGLPSSSNGVGAILGGGMDLHLWKQLSLRLFEADYVWAHHNFADAAAPEFSSLRRPELEGVRLRTGLLLNLWYPNEVAPTAACSASPTEVMVGEPITVSATGSGFNPKHTLGYSWNTTGGKLSSTSSSSATIDTNGADPGSYTATARVSDARMKKGGEASCSTTFTVKPLPPKNPPTMSCSADPTNVKTGEPSTITCSCTSPDNVPVTVGGWTATGGSISGSGSTATLSTAGAASGPITVSATCTDSRGLTSPATTAQVTVENPPPPPPMASKLSQCDFPNEKKPWRVDNTCKAILDDVAKNLQQNADNRLVIVGNADPSEKRKNLAGERAVNSKAYLSGGEAKQGIDPSRIETRTGSGGSKTAEYWIIPAGASFTEEGTQTVDEAKVKAVPDHPAVKPMGRKKAAKKAE